MNAVDFIFFSYPFVGGAIICYHDSIYQFEYDYTIYAPKQYLKIK
jgi:hypothetical protein